MSLAEEVRPGGLHPQGAFNAFLEGLMGVSFLFALPPLPCDEAKRSTPIAKALILDSLPLELREDKFLFFIKLPSLRYYVTATQMD